MQGCFTKSARTRSRWARSMLVTEAMANVAAKLRRPTKEVAIAEQTMVCSSLGGGHTP